MKLKVLLLTLSLAACSETTNWEYNSEIYAGEGGDSVGYSAPTADHSDPTGVGGDSAADSDSSAESNENSSDNNASEGQSKGHDNEGGYGKGHGKGHDND